MESGDLMSYGNILVYSGTQITSSIFPRVKNSENEDINVVDLVANLEVSHEELAHLAGIELRQA